MLNNLTGKEVTVEKQAQWKSYEKLLGNYEDSRMEEAAIILRPFETMVLDSKSE